MTGETDISHHKSASHVTDKEAQVVVDFAAEVCAYLSLPRYRFLIMGQPCQGDALASIHVVPDRWVAELYLAEDWMEWKSEARMVAVIHEVCHLLHRELDYVMNHSLVLLLSQRDHDLIHEQYRHQAELMVDHLASYVVRTSTVRETWDKFQRRRKK